MSTQTSTSAASSIEVTVRAVLEEVVRAPLAQWPAAEPLDQVPDAVYDSLAQLEAATRLEKEFGLQVGALDVTDVRTIATAVQRLARIQETAQ